MALGAKEEFPENGKVLGFSSTFSGSVMSAFTSAAVAGYGRFFPPLDFEQKHY
jgi:hypothetical protein